MTALPDVSTTISIDTDRFERTFEEYSEIGATKAGDSIGSYYRMRTNEHVTSSSAISKISVWIYRSMQSATFSAGVKGQMRTPHR